MKDLLAKVREQRLFAPGETVVVAVSGGADSVVLLDLLVRLAELRLNLVVAHLNHGLRGDASDGDERFVARLAAGYGLPCALRRVEVAADAACDRLSLEEAGRRARYAFFDDTARAHGAASIALAHHRDDQAETVLIRLLRGAGGGGLSAMESCSQGRLKRPLLKVPRREIERYLSSRGLDHRTDESNADTTILRNSIRHELIPLLTRYNPKVVERLAATAEILACDEELLAELTETAFRRLSACDRLQVVLDAAALALEPRGLRLRLYRRALLERRGDLREIGLAHLEAIDRLVASARPNARLKLPGECSVQRSYGSLFFRAREHALDPGFELTVPGEGSYPLPAGGHLQVRRVPRPAVLDPGSRRVALLSPEAAPFPWTLRSFLPGDRFTPLGMQGGQKVKALFINEKIPPGERGRIPLLLSRGRILWVLGVRMAEEARVGPLEDAVYRVDILDNAP